MNVLDFEVWNGSPGDKNKESEDADQSVNEWHLEVYIRACRVGATAQDSEPHHALTELKFKVHNALQTISISDRNRNVSSIAHAPVR